MDDDRLAQFARQRKLFAEQSFLEIVWCAVVVVIQADLTDRDSLRVRGQLAHFSEPRIAGEGSVVRLDPNDRVDLRVVLCQLDRCMRRFQIIADLDHPRHIRRGRALDDCGAVVIELRQMQMHMRIYKTNGGRHSFILT